MGLSLSEGTSLIANSARSRTAASRVHPTGGLVRWGKVARHNGRVHSAAVKNSGGRKRA